MGGARHFGHSVLVSTLPLLCSSTKTAVIGVYQTTVLREARHCGGNGWQTYDDMFRQQVANNPSADWSKIIIRGQPIKMGGVRRANTAWRRTTCPLNVRWLQQEQTGCPTVNLPESSEQGL